MSSCIVDRKPMLERSGESGYTLVELLVAMAIAGIVGGAIVGVYRVSQDSYLRSSSLEAAQLGARVGLDRMANELRLIGSYWVGANGSGNAITAATPTSITFMGNVNDLSVISGAEAITTSIVAGTSVPLSITTAQTDDAFKIYVANPDLNNDYIYITNGGRRDVRRITEINGSTLTIASAPSSSYPNGSLVRDVKTITYTRNATATSTCPALTCLTRSQGGSGADPLVNNVTGLTFTYFNATGGALGTNPNAALIREIQIDLTVQGTDGSRRSMTTRVRARSLP